MSHYVYMARCKDASIYTGMAEEVPFRVGQHNRGEIVGCYTATRRPVKLIYTEEYETRHDAFVRERQLKGWPRAKKEALANGNLERLKWLSRSYADRVSARSIREGGSRS